MRRREGSTRGVGRPRRGSKAQGRSTRVSRHRIMAHRYKGRPSRGSTLRAGREHYSGPTGLPQGTRFKIEWGFPPRGQRGKSRYTAPTLSIGSTPGAPMSKGTHRA
jgi:hypothetical protein